MLEPGTQPQRTHLCDCINLNAGARKLAEVLLQPCSCLAPPADVSPSPQPPRAARNRSPRSGAPR